MPTIDIQRERLIALADVPSSGLIPKRRGGRRLHVSTVFRWVKRGVRGVKLEAIRVGGTLCVSVESLQTFFDRLTDPTAPTTSERAERTSQQKAAARYLDEKGIGT